VPPTDPLSADLASLRISRDDPPPPRKAGGWIAASAALAGTALLATLGLPYAKARVFKTEIATTEIGLVSPAQATVDLTATGYVVPQVTAKVGAKVTGRVVKVNIHEGSVVKAGDVLFELDPADQKSAVAAAAAKVASAHMKASVARARADVARANVAETRIQLERNKKLLERGAANAATVDDMVAHMASLESQVKAADGDAIAADADAVAAQADMSALMTNLANMTIPAPMGGTAVTKPAEVGDVVTPSGTLVELVDFDSLRVEVDVPESRLGMIKPGSPCEVVLDAYPDKRQRGEVTELSPRLDRAKATGVAKVRFVDGLAGVLPEMAARVSFLARALDPSEMKAPPKKIIPASAVAERAGGKVAFVLDGDKVRMVALKLGAPFAGGFEVMDGPAPGTHVVKDPPATLSDGQSVKEGGGAG
jgi:RND family efflux transporter MFP subunit